MHLKLNTVPVPTLNNFDFQLTLPFSWLLLWKMNLAFAHEPGTAISCLSIPIILHKEGAPGIPETELKCGFKIGGGIDQDYRKSPQVTFFVLFSLSHFYKQI